MQKENQPGYRGITSFQKTYSSPRGRVMFQCASGCYLKVFGLSIGKHQLLEDFSKKACPNIKISLSDF